MKKKPDKQKKILSWIFLIAFILGVIKVGNGYVSSTRTADGWLCVYESGTIGVREDQACPMFGPLFGSR